ncbi:MAG: M48 family metallopeptidase [Candidatus Omnitrophica bacterium]|nr:M48 family metallopeptidase [Candidatus Omnitrophota bacterium]MBU4478603.1 M48 family metallopeptidase [Candidatus Omnitrophota bacterium]
MEIGGGMAQIQIKVDRIVRSRRRTLALEITPDARLIVRAPLSMTDAAIKHFVTRKKVWIRKHQTKARIKHEKISPKQFVDGEEFLYLGRPFRFCISERKSIALTDVLEFPKDFMPQARFHLVNWYRKKALEIFSQRVRLCAQWNKLEYASVRISNAKKRLGSCASDGRLSFSWRLVMSPLHVIDYVVAHELAHLLVMNHSVRFWLKVNNMFPGYRESRRWLKGNAHLLNIAPKIY